MLEFALHYRLPVLSNLNVEADVCIDHEEADSYGNIDFEEKVLKTIPAGKAHQLCYQDLERLYHSIKISDAKNKDMTKTIGVINSISEMNYNGYNTYSRLRSETYIGLVNLGLNRSAVIRVYHEDLLNEWKIYKKDKLNSVTTTGLPQVEDALNASGIAKHKPCQKRMEESLRFWLSARSIPEVEWLELRGYSKKYVFQELTKEHKESFLTIHGKIIAIETFRKFWQKQKICKLHR